MRAVIKPLDLLQSRRFPPSCSTAAVPTRYPPTRSLRHYTPRSRVHAIMIHRATFYNESSPRVAHSLGTVRLLAKLVCRHVSPRYAITPYLLRPQPTFSSGVRTANKNIYAVRRKTPFPLRTARVHAVILPRDFQLLLYSSI